MWVFAKHFHYFLTRHGIIWNTKTNWIISTELLKPLTNLTFDYFETLKTIPDLFSVSGSLLGFGWVKSDSKIRDSAPDSVRNEVRVANWRPRKSWENFLDFVRTRLSSFGRELKCLNLSELQIRWNLFRWKTFEMSVVPILLASLFWRFVENRELAVLLSRNYCFCNQLKNMIQQKNQNMLL
jgi:hypothetical protein